MDHHVCGPWFSKWQLKMMKMMTLQCNNHIVHFLLKPDRLHHLPNMGQDRLWPNWMPRLHSKLSQPAVPAGQLASRSWERLSSLAFWKPWPITSNLVKAIVGNGRVESMRVVNSLHWLKKKTWVWHCMGKYMFFFSPSWMHIESLLRLSASAYADKAFMCFSLFFYVFSVAIYVSNSLYRRFSYAKVVIFRGYEAISPQGCAAYLARLISSLHGGPTSQQRSPLAPCSWDWLGFFLMFSSSSWAFHGKTDV